MAKNKRTSWTQTIKRWFGLKAEAANEAMDSSVDIETQLNRKIRELKAQREGILNNPNLSKAIGLPDQLDEELCRLKRAYDNENYDKTIKALMQANKKEQARTILTKKKAAEERIERTKELLIQASQNKKKIQNDLDMLDANIAKANEQLEELKQRNEFAEQSNDIYELMNEIGNISVGLDSEGIEAQIRQKEQIAHGRRSEHDRRNATATAARDIANASLDAELESYL